MPKLLDFGLAKTAKDTLTAMTSPHTEDSTWSGTIGSDIGALRGTPPYLSPEVLGGAEPSASDDLWSLSVTLLEACTGTNPFRGATVAATVVKILTSHGRVLDAIQQTHPTLAPLFGVLLGPLHQRAHDAKQFVQIVREFSTKEA